MKDANEISIKINIDTSEVVTSLERLSAAISAAIAAMRRDPDQVSDFRSCIDETDSIAKTSDTASDAQS